MNEMITVENGKGIIDIDYDGFVGCLKIEKPIGYDKYNYDELDYYKTFWFNADHKKIDELYNFNTVLIFGTDEEVKTEIYSFLNIFSSGKYKVRAQILNLRNYDLHKDYIHLRDSTNYIYSYESKAKFGPYNREPCNIMFTMLYSDICYERVRFYKDLIEKGLKPKIVVSGYEDVFFILDGHHKYLAYQLLHVPAEIISITRLGENSEEEMLNLFLNYQFILSDAEKIYIFSELDPFLLTDKSDKTLKYNALFDHYLNEFDGQLSIHIFRLLLKAIKSDKEEERIVGNQKLDIIRNRDFSVKRIFIYKIISPGNVGMMHVNSEDEFNTIIEELLNTSDGDSFIGL